MPSSQPFARNDTMLGVCQSLGEDLGFNPNYLRVLFGALLIWNPMAVIAIYFGLAVIIALSHLVFPSRLRAADTVTAEQAAVPATPAPEPLVELAKAA
jgi:phage shock protein C